MSDKVQWYQSKDALLNGKIEKKYKDLEPILKVLCPGKSVLDIGCNGGLVSILSLKHGAKNVVGIDKRDHAIIQARMGIASWKKMGFISNENAEFISGNISDYFDLVDKSNFLIMIRSIYHLRENILNILNKAQNNKDMIMLIQGNPRRKEKEKKEKTMYGNKLVFASSISSFLKSYNFETLILDNEIVIAKHKESNLNFNKIKKEIKGAL